MSEVLRISGAGVVIHRGPASRSRELLFLSKLRISTREVVEQAWSVWSQRSPAQRREELRDMEHFGNYVRRLREVRGMTQEELAERSKLASDTIRRLERESFSPSLKTLRKLCAGLGITLSTLFNGFELPTTDTGLNDLIALLRSASPRTLQIIIRVVRELIRLLDD